QDRRQPPVGEEPRRHLPPAGAGLRGPVDAPDAAGARPVVGARGALQARAPRRRPAARPAGRRGRAGARRRRRTAGIAGRRLVLDPQGADPDLEARIVSLLGRLGLPTDLDAHLDPEQNPTALSAIAVDKKRAGSRVRYVALPRAGAARVVPLEALHLTNLLLS